MLLHNYARIIMFLMLVDLPSSQTHLLLLNLLHNCLHISEHLIVLL